MEHKTMNIYLSDLTGEALKAVLNFYNIKDEDELNFDVFPLFTLEIENEEENN